MGAAGEVNYLDLIAKMTFPEYAQAFGTLWVQDPVTFEIGYKPWDFWDGVDGEPGQLDFAALLQAMRTFWSPKARQKGASEIWSLYAKFVLEREPKSQAKVFSATKTTAKEFLELRFARKIEGQASVYPDMPGLRWEIGKDRCDCENGSYIQVYSSDDAGARGGSQRLTLLDEAREYADADFKNMLQAMGPSLRGKNQLAILSSGKNGSAFNIRIRGTDKAPGLMDLPSPRPSIWISPDQKDGMVFLNDFLDPEHREPGWRERELSGPLFGGDEIRFNSEHPRVIGDIFTSHEGLVISSWDRVKHVVDMKIEWAPHHEFYLFYDHGASEGHPAVAHFLQYDPYVDFVYIFDEIFERGMELSDINKKIKERLQHWRRVWSDDWRYYHEANDIEIKPMVRPYGDVRGLYGTRHIGDIMREETGLSFITVHKRDEKGSLELAKARFYRGGITHGIRARGGIAYAPRCRNSITQTENLRYKPGKDEPEDKENDAVDLLKYESYQVFVREPTPEPTYEQKQQERVRAWRQSVRTGTMDAPKVSVDTAWLKA